jgi:hypothetical protein
MTTEIKGARLTLTAPPKPFDRGGIFRAVRVLTMAFPDEAR